VSREEARHRLQAADPNLTIVNGRRSPKTYTEEKPMRLLPKVLSDVEAEWWGLTFMIPDFPPEEILIIEAKWSKKELQQLAMENNLEPRGDKELLISKLLYVGVLDDEGKLVTDQELELAEARLPQTDKKPPEKMPRINPHASAIEQDRQLRGQLRWLKEHGFKTARAAQEAGY